MSPRKIVVFGGTGKQGGSVVRALAADNNYEVVGITRNPDSAGAKEVAALGATVIKGDMNNVSTIAPALKGAYGVFLVTDFWATYNGTDGPEAQRNEVKQAKGIIDVVAAAGVRHLVFSTLESYRPRQLLPHFDGKADVTGYIRTLELPATQLYTSYYFSNVHSGFGPSVEKQSDGSFIVRNPLPDDTVLPSFAVEQTGLWAKAAFDDPEQWIGQDMQAAGENTTVADVAKHLAAVSGKKVVTEGHTREAFLASSHPDEELRLQWRAMFNGEVKRDVEGSRKIVPGAWGFTDWVKQSKTMRDVLGF